MFLKYNVVNIHIFSHLNRLWSKVDLYSVDKIFTIYDSNKTVIHTLRKQSLNEYKQLQNKSKKAALRRSIITVNPHRTPPCTRFIIIDSFLRMCSL